MFERIITILRKEFKQILRDPRMRVTMFIAPLFQLLVFGFAATTDVSHIPTAIYDLDNTPQSRSIIRDFSYSEYFNVKYYINNDKDQLYLVDKSLVNVVIRFNRGFAQDLEGLKGAKVQFILDGTDSNTAAIILSYANVIMNKFTTEFMKTQIMPVIQKVPQVPKIDLRSRAWFNENLESRLFYIPGVIALIISIMSLLLTSMAIVREKEVGTIEQLMVSPLKPYELILGKLLPFGIIAIVDVVLVTILGVFVFDIPLRGSLTLLFFSTLVYLLTTLGVGLFISTISATQQEAMMSVFLFFFPVNLLSGFMFPIFNMPPITQYITYLNPLRYYLIILRGVFLKGIGIKILWPEILILLVMGVGVIYISSLRFHKRLG